MRRRLENDLSYSLPLFRDDMKLMISNATKYNLKGEPVYGMALELGHRFDELLAATLGEQRQR